MANIGAVAKAKWQDAPLALWDFSRSNKQKFLANAAISLHSHTHLHQSILPILYCGFKLVSSSQLSLSSHTKGFLRIVLRGFISNGSSVFICLIISFSISEELLASEKDFEQFFVSLFKHVHSIVFCFFFPVIFF